MKLAGVDLNRRNLINSWIGYKSEEKKLMVFLRYYSSKPKEPILFVDIDLSDYLKEYMDVGFAEVFKLLD